MPVVSFFCINSNHYRGGGALVSEAAYYPRKKIHVIRVVFQDQAMFFIYLITLEVW